MTKINICLSEKDVIDGYQNITPNQLNTIVNGSVNEIIFRGLDFVTNEQRSQIIVDILNKVKNNGEVTFEFLDLVTMSKEAYLGSMTSKAISSLIDGKRSLGYEDDIVHIVENFPQFKIKNRFNHGQNIVMTIIKELKNEK